MVKFNINDFLERYYTEDEPIILACSTGPDSMFILYEILKTRYAKNLVACYFNHKLRKEADDEERFLEELGKKHNFKVEIAEAKIKEIRDNFYPSLGLEEVAREKRYAFLNAILNIYNTDKIITGHHLDDKIETFFFNLARGTKLTGLINMTEKSGSILRPLINLEKNEILGYLDENNLEYKIDKTNFDTDITRNKLRHDIIPQFKKINTNYKENISNLISYFEEIKDFLDKEVKDFLEEQGILIFNSGKYKINTLSINGYFYIDDFNKLTSLLQKEIIKHIYFISNGNSTIGLSEANIAEVLRFINGKNNKTVKEIKEMKLEKNNKIIIF
ncbi:MAG: tRNA lysidine(34) synthetase TilS [Candidatus Gracilibacteria bacterium]|nr:tRNA lysidine(34) synthetase TilS [Candidatus Gracilibacteria bacterium]